MKFEKRFVYCVWDDVLINKEVVAAGCMSSLIAKVEHDDDYLMPDTSVCVGCNESVDYPFKICATEEDDFTESYSFVYYDPNYMNKLAFENGKQIQYLNCNEWFDVDNPVWDDITTYRVKPDEPKHKYRPYKDIDEFVSEYRAMCHIFGEPLVIWLKDTEKDAMFMCDGLDKTDNTVHINSAWWTLVELLEEYTYLDGTPLGVKE